jgi:release factor glutamine methyltransferase
MTQKEDRAPKWFRRVNEIRTPSLFPSLEKQKRRINERRNAELEIVTVCGIDFEVFPNVYQTSVDTELLAKASRIRGADRFLEIGCGCGAVSIILGKQGRCGVGVDINPAAVENAIRNAGKHDTDNVDFFVSDVFENVTGVYDVIVCNPPYNCHPAEDVTERMFWDPGDEMKRRFFEQVDKFLAPNGRIYFGWGDFSDIDGSKPLSLAASAGLTCGRFFAEPTASGGQRFFVLEFRRGKVKGV